jgi:hypothetical protein
VYEEAEILGLNRAGPPMWLRDMPVPPEQTRGWAEFMWPAGFREGLGVGLFTPDGRHIGMLTLNTDAPAHPTDMVRDLIGLLGPLIAHAVDPMRSVVALARIVEQAEAGIALTRSNDPVALPPCRHITCSPPDRPCSPWQPGTSPVKAFMRRSRAPIRPTRGATGTSASPFWAARHSLRTISWELC